jgi:hypothetical protein
MNKDHLLTSLCEQLHNKTHQKWHARFEKSLTGIESNLAENESFLIVGELGKDVIMYVVADEPDGGVSLLCDGYRYIIYSNETVYWESLLFEITRKYYNHV